MLQPIIHYGVHFVFPILVALVVFKAQWKTAYVIMLCTMIIDLDHLLATPIFDPNRCSINFHPLHTYWAMIGYVILIFFPKTRVIGIGLLFHMFTDGIDCIWLLNQ